MDLADAVGIQIRLRGDKMNAVKRRRTGGIDRHEPGMRKRRPQERHGKPFAGFQIIRIPTASGQKSRVLQPWNGLTDAEFHVRLLFCVPRPTRNWRNASAIRVDVVIQHSAPNPQARGMKSAGTDVTMTKNDGLGALGQAAEMEETLFPRLSVEMPRF